MNGVFTSRIVFHDRARQDKVMRWSIAVLSFELK